MTSRSRRLRLASLVSMCLMSTCVALLPLARAAHAVEVSVSSPLSVDPGQTFTATVSVADVTDLVSLGLVLDYDPAILQYGTARVTANVPPASPGFEPVFLGGPPFEAFVPGDGTSFALGSLVEVDFIVVPAAPLGATTIGIAAADLGVDAGNTEISLTAGDPGLTDRTFFVGPAPATVPLLSAPGWAGLAATLLAAGSAAAARRSRTTRKREA